MQLVIKVYGILCNIYYFVELVHILLHAAERYAFLFYCEKLSCREIDLTPYAEQLKADSLHKLIRTSFHIV